MIRDSERNARLFTVSKPICTAHVFVLRPVQLLATLAAVTSPHTAQAILAVSALTHLTTPGAGFDADRCGYRGVAPELTQHIGVRRARRMAKDIVYQLAGELVKQRPLVRYRLHCVPEAIVDRASSRVVLIVPKGGGGRGSVLSDVGSLHARACGRALARCGAAPTGPTRATSVAYLWDSPRAHVRQPAAALRGRSLPPPPLPGRTLPPPPLEGIWSHSTSES